jgi:peptide/nickel transport system permease protein
MTGRKTTWTAAVGISLVGLFVVCGLLGPLLTSQSPVRADLDHRMLPPVWPAHLFGTDESGIDLFTEILYGARVALIIGAATISICATIGVTLGAVAGYLGGWIDELVMRIVDVLLAFPGLLLNLAVVAVVKQPGKWLVVFALCLNGWVGFARVARGQVLGLREREYVAAARAMGAGTIRTILRHIIPNIMGPVLVQMTIGLGGVIATEAALSFLGVGPQLNYSWGALLDQGRGQLWHTQRIALAPGLALALVVVGCNLLGDALRDRWDPRRARL